MSILDELVFVPAPLRVLSPQSVDTFPPLVNAANGAWWTTDPWIVGHTRPPQVGPQWKTLCERLNALNLLIDASARDLDALPAPSRPQRISQQRAERSFSSSEIHSADLVELVCQSAIDGRWGWPPEIEIIENLPLLIQSFRATSERDFPVGIGLPVGVDTESIEIALRAGADFLAIHAAWEQPDELVVESLVRARRTRERLLRGDMPIVLRVNHAKIDHLIKLVALGASFVTIDGVLADLWRSGQPPTASGFLASVEGSSPSPRCPIVARLQQLNHALQSVWLTHTNQNLTSLRESLRATTEFAAKIANVPLLDLELKA